MTLTSIKTKIFLGLGLLLAAVAGLVMTASQSAVENAVVESEERAIDNALALIEANVRGRYRTLLKDKVKTVQTRKEALRDFDTVVTETLEDFAGLADSGRIPEARAKQLAINWLSQTQPVGGDYIFAFDADNRALVYPEWEMLNTDLSRFTDVKGRSVVVAARDEAGRYGETYLTYNWKKVGDTTIVPKYGHFIPFRRWDWIIGSVGDVGAVRRQVDRQLAQLIGELKETLPRITMAGGGVAFIFDGDGRFVVPPRADSAAPLSESVIRRLSVLSHEIPVDGTQPVLAFRNEDGETFEGRATYLKALDWHIATVSSRDALRAPAEALIRQQAVVFVAALAIGLALAYLFAYRIGQPLVRLAGFARTVSETDFSNAEAPSDPSAALPVDRRDEVGHLAKSFVFMNESLHRNVRSLMEATSARERIEGELNVARDIQMGLLPKVFPAFPDRPEIDLCSTLVSAKEVGGDLFDYYFLDDRHLCFTIGDVAGKGVPAALFMAITKTLIKAAAEKGADAATMLDKINDDLSHDNPNSIFVTLVVGILDVETGVIRYANAGHNPPAVLRASGDVDILRARSGPAAGVMDGLDYAPLETRIAPGETLVLYTDGVTEAMDENGSLYGDDRLVELLRGTSRTGDADGVIRRIMADVKTHAGAAEQSDDITALALRFLGPETARTDAPAASAPPPAG